MNFRIKKNFVIKIAALIFIFAFVSCSEPKCRPSSCYIDTKITRIDSNGVTYMWDTKKVGPGDTIRAIFDGTMRNIIRGRNACYFMITESPSKRFSYYLETEKLLNQKHVKELPKGHYEILLFMHNDCARVEEARRRYLEGRDEEEKRRERWEAHASERKKFLDSINAEEWRKPALLPYSDSNAAKILDYLDRLPEL
ncbi:MAG: hypothetical protein LBU56_02020 [Rickettsiales bacterium]|jgi:hypothetical protein|nr:hypothetical protein [Rickettsiales bacterium]